MLINIVWRRMNMKQNGVVDPDQPDKLRSSYTMFSYPDACFVLCFMYRCPYLH